LTDEREEESNGDYVVFEIEGVLIHLAARFVNDLISQNRFSSRMIIMRLTTNQCSAELTTDGYP
jgi:hypothetical protein